jgi:hypothetical protein
LYSLAVVAYEMLTGRPPFVAETPAAVILAQIQGELPPPRELNPQLSPAVEAVLLKGLARNPDDRFPKCAALIGALSVSDREAPAVLPPAVLPPAVLPPAVLPPPRPASVPAARGPLPVPALAAGLVTILLIAAIAAGAVLFGGALRSPAGPAGVTASSTSAPTPRASPSLLPPQRLEADLPDARQEAAAAALGDTLYVMGGLDASAKSIDVVDVYAQGAWQTGPKLPLGLDHAAAAVLKGQLYLAAGYSAGKAGAGAFRLNGSAWQALAPMHHARGALALIALGDRLYAIGGESGGTQVAATETYDPAANAWTDLPALPQPRNHVAGFLYHNLACVAGGRPPETSRVDCYDPAAGAWSALPSLPTVTAGASAGSFGDEVVVAGGENTMQNVLVDQLARLTEGGWRAGPMQVPRHGIAMALLGGRLWACGGGTAVGLHPVPTCTSIGPGGA